MMRLSFTLIAVMPIAYSVLDKPEQEEKTT
ncbi:hypothetical protein PCC7811_04613 [Planktothrix agardhii]|nr:hypothetical protein PCC7811_04613 [Planktothrix agardhii]